MSDSLSLVNLTKALMKLVKTCENDVKELILRQFSVLK